jgi:hypothetical protein
MLMLTILPVLFGLLGEEPEASSSELVTGIEATATTSEDAPERVGFSKGMRILEVKVSRAFGTSETGSDFQHDLWVMQFHGGIILAEFLEPGTWFGGGLEAFGEILAGGQDIPEAAYLVGASVGLRYHFRTGTQFVPFVGGSFGIAITDIGDPDASGKFQFHEQIGTGLHYLISNRHAVSCEYTYWHISNGRIREPNAGVNNHTVSVGFAWLF